MASTFLYLLPSEPCTVLCRGFCVQCVFLLSILLCLEIIHSTETHPGGTVQNVWVFVSVQGLSLVVASGGHSSSRCAGPSPSRPLPLRSTGSRRTGSAIVAHGPSCSAACVIFPDQGSNPCPLHWQADSQPLRHQESPVGNFLITVSISVLVIGLLIFSISSWFSLGRLYLSKNLSVSSRLSILLAYSCL